VPLGTIDQAAGEYTMAKANSRTAKREHFDAEAERFDAARFAMARLARGDAGPMFPDRRQWTPAEHIAELKRKVSLHKRAGWKNSKGTLGGRSGRKTSRLPEVAARGVAHHWPASAGLFNGDVCQRRSADSASVALLLATLANISSDIGSTAEPQCLHFRASGGSVRRTLDTCGGSNHLWSRPPALAGSPQSSLRPCHN